MRRDNQSNGRHQRSSILNVSTMIVLVALPYWDIRTVRLHGGLGLQLPTMVALLAVGLLLATGHIARPSAPNWWLAALVGYYAVVGLCLVLKDSTLATNFMKSLLILTMYVVIFASWIPMTHDARPQARMAEVFLVAGVPELMLGTYQVMASVFGLPDWSVPAAFLAMPASARLPSASAGMISYLRPEGMFAEPAHYGVFLGLYILVAWSLTTETRRISSPRLRRFVVLANWWAIVLFVLSFSLSAWLYLVVAFGLSYCVWRLASPRHGDGHANILRSFRTLALIVGSVLVVFVLVSRIVGPADLAKVWTRIQVPLADPSFRLRVMAGLELIQVTLTSCPVFGMGLGLVATWLSVNYPNPVFIRGAGSTMPYVVDSSIASIVASGGIVGSLLFVGAAVNIVRSQLRRGEQCRWTGLELLGLRVAVFLLIMLFFGGSWLACEFWIPLTVFCKPKWDNAQLGVVAPRCRLDVDPQLAATSTLQDSLVQMRNEQQAQWTGIGNATEVRQHGNGS